MYVEFRITLDRIARNKKVDYKRGSESLLGIHREVNEKTE